MPTPELFDAAKYPTLRKHANTYRGRATLLSVSETSDGFLTGYAHFKDGDYTHSVFLGRVENFREVAPC